MKKRTMLAFASLATGVVTALVTPNANAAPSSGGLDDVNLLTGNSVLDSVLDGDSQKGQKTGPQAKKRGAAHGR